MNVRYTSMAVMPMAVDEIYEVFVCVVDRYVI